jgi:hypothetical protein
MGSSRGRIIVGDASSCDPDAPDLSSKSLEFVPSSCRSIDMFEGGALKTEDELLRPDELRRFRNLDDAGVDENVGWGGFESSEVFPSRDSPRGASRNACVVGIYLELGTGDANREELGAANLS